MSIKIGDKIRYSVTQEEGAVVAMCNNASCVAVRFGNSFAYLIATKELELALPRLAFTDDFNPLYRRFLNPQFPSSHKLSLFASLPLDGRSGNGTGRGSF